MTENTSFATIDAAFKSVVISKEAKLNLKQNHLHIFQAENEANLYLKDIAFIILESPQITLTSALLSAFAKHKITLLSCDESHLINGIFTPFAGHFQSGAIAKAQMQISQQKKAILWQKIIKNKITNQAFVLAKFKHENKANELKEFAKNVKINDSSCLEGRAAAAYFKALFGKDFRREDLCFENAALNYGYAIVRAAIIRAVCVSGLCAWLGVKHDNALNAFCLADDLIEPFRAFVDVKVCEIHAGNEFLQKEQKRDLMQILQNEVRVDDKKLPLIRAVNHYTQGFKNALLGEHELPNVSFWR